MCQIFTGKTSTNQIRLGIKNEGNVILSKKSANMNDAASLLAKTLAEHNIYAEDEDFNDGYYISQSSSDSEIKKCDALGSKDLSLLRQTVLLGKYQHA